jgi:hypothetical protein
MLNLLVNQSNATLRHVGYYFCVSCMLNYDNSFTVLTLFLLAN